METSRDPIFRRASSRAIIAVLSALLLLSWSYGVRADGAPGDLDPDFGTKGKVITDLVVNGTNQDAILDALAVQPDGKLIAAGSNPFAAFVLMRYNPDGSLDPTFGDGGTVVTGFGPNIWLPYGIIPEVRLSSAGRIVVATSRFVVPSPIKLVRFIACYTADGKLDVSFGNGGMITDIPSANNDLLAQNDLLVQGDGRIIATANNGLICFSADGTRDMSFGTAGQTAVSDISLSQLAQQRDGRIIGAGKSSLNGFALARFLSDGSLDPSFGTGGVVTNQPGSGGVRQVRVTEDGRVMAVGSWNEGNNPYNLVLARYNADGSLDPAFGNGGTATISLDDSTYGPTALAVQPDGHIVIGVYSSAADFELMRFTPDGNLDLSFGYDGGCATDFSGRHDHVSALLAVGNDRVVAAGTSYTVNGFFLHRSSFALACYMATGTSREPDFELGFNSSVIPAPRGTKPNIEVTLYRIGGFTGDVTVIPPNPSAEGIIFKTPEPVLLFGPTASCKFKVKVKGWATPGQHVLTFVGKDVMGRERTATVALMVE